MTEEEFYGEDGACFANDFTGRFTGDVILDNVIMSVRSANSTFDIRELKVNGKNAMFNVCAGSVIVAKAQAGNGGKLCANTAQALTIVSGDQPHVHQFIETVEHEATCITPKVVKRCCSQCGYAEHMHEGEALGKCMATYLVHVAPRLSSSNQGGNVEYWECPFCGRQYSDAQGTAPLSGSPYLLATNYLEDEKLLHSLDDVFDWHKEFDFQSKAGGGGGAAAGVVLSVLGLIETLGLSIPGLVADDGPRWADINAKLDQIQTSLERIETKIDELAQKIDAVPYKMVVLDRNKKFNFLSTKSIPVFQLIDQYIKSNDANKGERIVAVIKDWSGNQFEGTNVADLTQSLMQQYVKTGLNTNVPGMFESVANDLYLWEHMGYNFRYQAVVRDVMLTGISYLLSGNYISSVKEYNNEELRKADIERLKSDFKAYSNAVKAELDRFKDRNEKFRRYNHAKVTFNIEAKSYDFHKWFVDHKDYGFPRLNQGGKAVASCEKILKDLGLDKDLGLTTPMAKEIYEYFNRNNKVKASIYTILRDSLGFKKVPDKFDPGLIFTNKTTGFDHENGDNAIPVYRMFHWEAYRSSNNSDYFGIRTCLNNSCSEENHNILFKCDINTYSGGKINKLGEETRWIWYTLVKVAN